MSNSCTGHLVLGPKGPRFLPAVPDDLGPGPRARGRPAVPVSHAWVRGSPESTSVPGILGHGSKGLRLTSCPGNVGPLLMYHRVNQLSRATRARVLGPTVSTSCPE